VARLYLVTGRDEIARRRRALGPGEIVEVWEALHAPDVAWLGDPELRRIAYQRDNATRTAGLFWIGESAKAALDRGGTPLPHLVALPETSVPIHYTPWLRDNDSLPLEESLRARVLSARGIAVAWVTYDAEGNRLEHEPADPLDPVFLLRRPRTKLAHAWHLFRSRADASRYASTVLQANPEGRGWVDRIVAEDFDDLVRRFGLGGSA
jgi:hypothetical protein